LRRGRVAKPDRSVLETHSDQNTIVRPRQRYTNELLAPDPNDIMYKTNPGSYASELHERFASPLYAFTFVLVVLAFMGQARTTRTSRLQAVIGAFAVAVLSRIVGITFAFFVNPLTEKLSSPIGSIGFICFRLRPISTHLARRAA
jgi:lipopolysaccharide export system permease protein